MSEPANTPVRVRFCPSPTGTPHVGLIRTALFNWAHARHHGGTFVFRIEDTDASRDSAESYAALLDALSWLGLNWDEGPEVGGPHAPYRQSERGPLYADALAKLIAAGEVYESFSSADEIEARHRAAGRDPKLGYDNADRDLSDEQRAAFRAEGRAPVYRLRMPDRDITFRDHVRGEVTFRAGSVPDFVLARGDGSPLYPLTNPLDDALMGITDVLRGEDLLSSTPRQIALHEAFARIGLGSGPAPLRPPAAGHRRGKPQAVQARPAVEPLPVPRARIHSGGPAQLPGAARLVDRRGPGRVHDGRDGGGVRHHPGVGQRRAIRRQKGRGHQWRASAGAAGRGLRPPGRALPRGRRRAGRPADRGAARAARARRRRSCRSAASC